MKKIWLFFLAISLPSLAMAQESRILSVNAGGDVFTTPDIAYLVIGVTAQSEKPTDAFNQVAEGSNNALSLIKELGIAEKDIQTQNISLNQYYAHDETYSSGQSEPDGFEASTSIRFAVHDFSQISTLFPKLLEAGINNISGPYYETSKYAELKRESLVLAIQNAKEMAQLSANELGMKLGQPIQITPEPADMSLIPVPMAGSMLTDMSEAQKAVSPAISTGQIGVSSHVSIIFELLPGDTQNQEAETGTDANTAVTEEAETAAQE